MAPSTFHLLLKTPRHEGASLDTVVAKLSALRGLYGTIFSSVVRPGAVKPTIPKDIKPYTEVKLLSANRSESLGFELQQPGPPPTGYDGAHHLLPRVGVEVFQKTMSVVPEGKTGELASIFPQKSDLVRAIVGLNKFLPLEHEPTVVLRGLNGGDDYQFLNRHREWLENEMPSLKSEKIKLTGMLKAGALGKKSVFRIFDGIRTITLLPSSDQTIDFRDLFGKVVELNGVAKYKPNGQISGVEEIENLAPHTHKVSSVESGERRFVFSRELSFSIDASTSEAGFLLSNQDLDIHSYGQSLREATEGISEQVEFLWDEYAQCDDNALHSSGKTLKDRILGIVEKVGPLNE